MRLLSAVLCAAAAWWLLPRSSSDACPAGPSPQIAPAAATAAAADVAATAAVAPDGCKPLAPIDVELSTPDGDGPGPVRAVVTVAPRLAMASLDWRWELSEDVRVARGELTGQAAPQRGERTTGEIELLVPNDGRPHRVEFVVTGRLMRAVATGTATGIEPDEQADVDAEGEAHAEEPELVTLVKTLRWGPMPEPGPIVHGPDPESGAWQAFVAVPARHTPAAATQVAPDGGR